MSPHRRQSVKPATTSSVKWAAQWIAVVIVSYVGLISALGAPYIFGHKIHVGDVAERDYAAPVKTKVIDFARTKQALEEARENMLPVFVQDPARNALILEVLNKKLDAVQQQLLAPSSGVRSSETKPADGGTAGSETTGSKTAGSKTADIAQATDSTVKAVAADLTLKDYPTWRSETERTTRRYLTLTHIFPGIPRTHWIDAVYEFLPDQFSPGLRRKTAQLIAGTLRPNMSVDAEATKQKLKATLSGSPTITRQIETGALIIQKGSRLTTEDVALLKQIGISHTHEVQNLVGVASALFAAFFLFGLFLVTFEQKFFYSPSAIALMATVCIVTCGIAAAVGHEYPQFVSLPATALVLTVVFGRRVSVVLALLVILFLKVSDLVDDAHLVALTAATAVALAVNITKRKELMIAGILIGVMQAVGYLGAVMLMGMPASALGVGRELVQNMLGGLSSSIVAIGSLPFLEIIFGVLTPFRVAELSEPDQPLLRQLEENAPGTYQHSLAVANLAEAGAKAVNADVNLVRAGAMYHDIGKMVTPRFFIENQLGDKNPHDEISPEESRAKVLAHVTNGLVLAHKYGLPKQVVDFIPEHQGTTIMAYFYHKACVRDGAANVNELDYRYPGPKPQCKETAIVMLADVSEAVTHSMRDPSQEEVEAAISNVFKARWDDGQFTEADISDQEMDKVKQAFVRVWRTLHHERLKYPSTTTGRMPVPPPMVPLQPPSHMTPNPAGSAEAPNGADGNTGTNGASKPTADSTLPLPPGADCC